MSFSTCSVPSKFRDNPIGQYNSSKLDMYRIDFFILSNKSSGHNFINHIDMYQGTHENNISIPPNL